MSTPVTVTMDEAQISHLHVSQNIPQRSPMTVRMMEAVNNQIHLSQAVPMNSPLTWQLTGDIGKTRHKVFSIYFESSGSQKYSKIPYSIYARNVERRLA